MANEKDKPKQGQINIELDEKIAEENGKKSIS